jgi:hypothetical protein
MQKSIITTLVVTLLSAAVMAQDAAEIRDLTGKNQWDKAKEAVDKYLAIEKNAKQGEGWYLKAVIYDAIAKDPKFSNLTADPRMDAFRAYQKYLEVDKDNFEGKLNQHSTLFDIAFGYLGSATDNFNGKKFDIALAFFKNAELVENYIVKKGFTYNAFAFPAYDTQLYLNTAAAAVNAKKEDVALEYYQKIADKKIAGAAYIEIYRYIVDRYNEKGDKEKRDKYFAIGKELYPKDEFWLQMELKEAGDDRKKLFAKYEELTSKNPDNYSLLYNYCVELFNYGLAQEKRPDDFVTVDTKLYEALKKTIALNSTAEANMLMCRYLFFHINDMTDAYNAVKGAKPDDIKKKKDLSDAMGKKYEEVLPYANTVYGLYDAKPALKPNEKGNFKLSCNMLLEYWDRKNDAAKVKFYQDKMASVR